MPGHLGGFWEQVTPSGTTTTDPDVCRGGGGDRRPLQWRMSKTVKDHSYGKCNNSAAQEEATHTSYFTREHLIERIWQQGAEGLQDREEAVEPI